MTPRHGCKILRFGCPILARFHRAGWGIVCVMGVPGEPLLLAGVTSKRPSYFTPTHEAR